MPVKRVLIVDDSRAARDMMKKIVVGIQPGLTVHEAMDGAEAVDRCRLSAYDLVLLDITMPEMDGITALQHIRAESPATRVVMVTAHRSRSKVEEARKLGAFGYLGKPFTMRHIRRLFEAIEKTGASRSEPASSPEEVSDPALADARVLVADDSRTHRTIVKKYLTQLELGVAVDEAQNGEEAVEMYRRNDYDLVFLDVNMPKLGGVRALEEIRIVDPQATVYMISANAGEEIESECRALGARRFLRKPFGRDAIDDAVAESVTLL